MLVTRLKCAGGLADLMTRKYVKIIFHSLILIVSYPLWIS